MPKNHSLFLGGIFTINGIFLLVFLYNNLGFITLEKSNLKKHRVVLIVLDAFRHDYPEIARARQIDLVNINRMVASGARSMKVLPVYPSVTMPNHQSLVTGLYSPYHGITHNTFKDTSIKNSKFAMGQQTSLNEARWYDGYPDPAWVTCEKHAHCRSGSMLWPNTDAVFNGHRPYRYVDQYISLNQEPNVVYPYDRRVDIFLNWMKVDLIDFGMLYFDEPDAISHAYGPLHENTLRKLKEMDVYIGRLIKGLEDEDLLKTTDIILTGDHGMTELSSDRVIQMDKFVPPEWYESTYSYPVGIIYSNEGKFDDVFNSYSKASGHIKVYKREDVPKELHYSDNSRRISPIVTVIDNGWFVNSSHYRDKLKKGMHGYSPYEDDMKTTLLAMGPSFRRTTLETSSHVDLYPLMMHLLGLSGHPNNGSLSRLLPLLTDNAKIWSPMEDRWALNKVSLIVCLILVFQILSCLSFFIGMCCVSRARHSGLRRVAKHDPEQSVALMSSE